MLVLASASPRRHQLLLAAGIPHVIRPASISEHRNPGEPPKDFVQRIAEAKARAILASPEDIILGADTVVSVKSEIFGKPSSDEDAARMLRRLSGADHCVYTGICILSGTRRIVDFARTRVSFAELTEEEVREYTRSGEPRDKAGGYAIQGLASKFVRSIEGCYFNVVGLPLSLVYVHLKTL